MIGRKGGEAHGFAVRTGVGQNLVSRWGIGVLNPVGACLALEASLGDEFFQRVAGEFVNRFT